MDNKYKETNRAMAAENQKLKKHLADLKTEVLHLNRQLMAEQRNSRGVHTRLMHFIMNVSKTCNDAVQGLHEEIADLKDDDNKENRKSSFHQKTESLRRSIQLVKPLFRQDRSNDNGIEESINNLQPMLRQDQSRDHGEEESMADAEEDRRQFVQIRSKSNIETYVEEESTAAESYQEETNQEAYQEETNSTEVLNAADESVQSIAKQLEEGSVYMPHLISTIQEEHTKDLTKSSERGLTVSKSIISIDNSEHQEPDDSFEEETSRSVTESEPSSRSLEELSDSETESANSIDSYAEEISKSRLNLNPSSSITINSSNELLAEPAKTLQQGTVHSAFMELTNLHAFSSVSLSSSTPRKPLRISETKNCSVRLKKLTHDDLRKWSVTSNEKNSNEERHENFDKVASNRRRKRINISPKASLIRISIPRVSSPQVTTKCCSRFSMNTSRPRRNAAPSSLQEPSLRCKLRRNP